MPNDPDEHRQSREGDSNQPTFEQFGAFSDWHEISLRPWHVRHLQALTAIGEPTALGFHRRFLVLDVFETWIVPPYRIVLQVGPSDTIDRPCTSPFGAVDLISMCSPAS